MRRSFAIGLMLVAIAAGVLIGVGAYHAGYTHGVDQVAAAGGRVVRAVGPGYGPRDGFFPFGFLLFPLFIIGIILLFRGLAWRHWGGWDHHHGSGYGPGRREAFEDWHRRQHDQVGTGPNPSTPSSA
jgi:hypothetical protein